MATRQEEIDRRMVNKMLECVTRIATAQEEMVLLLAEIVQKIKDMEDA